MTLISRRVDWLWGGSSRQRPRQGFRRSTGRSIRFEDLEQRSLLTTGTGLDQLVSIINTDPGLKKRIPPAQIALGAAAADQMDGIIVNAIKATGLANDGGLSPADVRDLSAYIHGNYATQWVTLHGNGNGSTGTGFHSVKGNGATTSLFGKNAIETIADGIYHLGFTVNGGNLTNENGGDNASISSVSSWLNQLLKADYAAGTLVNKAVDPSPHATTGTGLDQLVNIIAADKGLGANIATSQITAAATAADRMDVLIVTAIKATGVANDGTITASDVRDISDYIVTNNATQWVTLHGSGNGSTGTGFHQAKGNGSSTSLFGRNAIETIADGVYHLGFGIDGNNLINEDGNANASVSNVASWLGQLLAADLKAGTLKNPNVNLVVTPSTGTGLDQLVTIITTDAGIAKNLSTSRIVAGARFADRMDRIIIEAIKNTGVADQGTLGTAAMRDVSDYITTNYADLWAEIHGSNDNGAVSGFHLVKDAGASTSLFGRNAIETIADNIYHLGFPIDGSRVTNEDGNGAATVSQVAGWVAQLLANDLAAGTLVNKSVNPYVTPSTGTGLDQLVTIITSDPGLNQNLSVTRINAGAAFADQMDKIIVEAIKNTGVANDGTITASDIRDINAYIVANYATLWPTIHGDTDGTAAAGFHLVKAQGASTQLFNKNAVETIADGIYHLGFPINGSRLTNEDGNDNAKIADVASWLSQLLAKDLAAGTLANPSVSLAVKPSTGTGLDQLVTTILNDPVLQQNLATTRIAAGARFADQMDAIIIEAIKQTGAAVGGTITVDGLRGVNAYIRSKYAALWVTIHGFNDKGVSNGFHLVKNQGANTQLLGKNAVETIADGIYHLGFAINGTRLTNENGNDNASLSDIASWLNQLLAADLAAGTLVKK